MPGTDTRSRIPNPPGSAQQRCIDAAQSLGWEDVEFEVQSGPYRVAMMARDETGGQRYLTGVGGWSDLAEKLEALLARRAREARQ